MLEIIFWVVSTFLGAWAVVLLWAVHTFDENEGLKGEEENEYR